MKQDGATEQEINSLPKFKFRRIGDFEIVNGQFQESSGGSKTECDASTLNEHVISQDHVSFLCLSTTSVSVTQCFVVVIWYIIQATQVDRLVISNYGAIAVDFGSQKNGCRFDPAVHHDKEFYQIDSTALLT